MRVDPVPARLGLLLALLGAPLAAQAQPAAVPDLQSSVARMDCKLLASPTRP